MIRGSRRFAILRKSSILIALFTFTVASPMVLSPRCPADSTIAGIRFQMSLLHKTPQFDERDRFAF
jgi:hypothetical protein